MNLALIIILIIAIVTIIINGSRYTVSGPIEYVVKAQRGIRIGGIVMLITLITLAVYNLFIK